MCTRQPSPPVSGRPSRSSREALAGSPWSLPSTSPSCPTGFRPRAWTRPPRLLRERGSDSRRYRRHLSRSPSSPTGHRRSPQARPSRHRRPPHSPSRRRGSDAPSWLVYAFRSLREARPATPRRWTTVRCPGSATPGLQALSPPPRPGPLWTRAPPSCRTRRTKPRRPRRSPSVRGLRAFCPRSPPTRAPGDAPVSQAGSTGPRNARGRRRSPCSPLSPTRAKRRSRRSYRGPHPQP